MQSARIWFLLALLPLLAACWPVIYSEHPLGEPAVLDPKEWNGRWLGSSHGSPRLGTISVVDSDTIRLRDADCDPSTEDRERDDRLRLRQYKNWYIFAEKPDSTSGLYVISLLLRRVGAAVEWFYPNEERVKALIEQGDLPGRIEDGRAILGALTPEHYALLFGPGTRSKYPRAAKDDIPYDPFEPQHPIMIKLPDELDPCRKANADK